MTGFVLVAVVLVVVALSWLLPALLRRRGPAADAQAGASNLAILRDHIAELRRDLDSGTLSAQQYQQSREDLERRALEETRDVAPSREGRPAAGRRTALVLVIAIPLCAALLYFQVGSPDALLEGAAAGDEHSARPQQVAAMVTGLAARLEKTPDDGDGWALLGRSYFFLQRYEDAAKAYARAATLITNDADLYADYADALAMSRGRKIDVEVLKIVERALQVNPLQWKALAIAGSGAFDLKDYKKAVANWEKLLQGVEPNSNLARTVTDNIAEARQLANIKPGVVAKAAPDAKAPFAAGTSVQGKVSLSPALTAKASPADTVFIFARAVQGPRMPLAIVRRQVKDLPFTFTLDDSQAMAPEMKLSKFGEVVVGARISKSANAMPQSGDLQGASAAVKVGAANVAVVIDSVVP